MKKIKYLIFMLVLLLPTITIFPTQSNAMGEFEIIEIYDPNNLITVQPYYKDLGTKDVIQLEISGTSAKSVNYATFSDSTYTTVTAEKTNYPADYGWSYFTGMAFNCNSYYQGILYDSSGNVLVRVKLHITGLVKPVCDSGSAGGDSGGGTDAQACADAVCECIEALKVVNQQILSATNGNGEKLQSVVDNLTPQITQTVPNVIPKPTLSTPAQNQTKFTDTQTYFNDEGDADTPMALPKAPEPKDWGFSRDPAGDKDVSQVKDPSLIKEPSQIKDPVGSRDPIGDKDPVGSRDPIGDKDPVGSRDPIGDKDPVGSRDPVSELDPVYSRDPVGTRDPVLTQDPIVTETPNWTSP